MNRKDCQAPNRILDALLDKKNKSIFIHILKTLLLEGKSKQNNRQQTAPKEFSYKKKYGQPTHHLSRRLNTAVKILSYSYFTYSLALRCRMMLKKQTAKQQDDIPPGKPGHFILLAMLSLFIQPTLATDKPYTNTSQPVIKDHGELTRFGMILHERLQTSSEKPKSHNHHSVRPLIYINTQGTHSKPALENIRSAYLQGAVVILDNTSGAEGAEKLSASISGIGIASPVLLIGLGHHHTPEYKILDISNSEDKPDSPLSPTEQAMVSLAQEAHTLLDDWDSNTRNRNYRQRNTQDSNQFYRPETSINVEFRNIGSPCMVGKDYHGNSVTGASRWTDEMIDACDGKASVSLFYTIDLVRSVASDDGSTEDAKYLRITLNPSGEGGAGWYFTDMPTHKTLWYESLTNRIEWFGPIVEDYTVTVSARDPEVRLFQAVPGNKPQNSNVVELPSIGIGVKIPKGLLNPAYMPFPSMGLSTGLVAGFTTDRAVIYKNHEYTIINRSSDNHSATAAWLWSREFDKYSESWRTNSTCLLWCDDPFFNDNAFSPAAYAHFAPGFSATFKVPGDKNDHSSFLFSGTANVVALAGRVQYKFLLQHYAPWSRKGSVHHFAQRWEVNWGSAFFNSDLPMSIEASREESGSGLCLNIAESDIDEGVGSVNLYDCHFRSNQIWGVDSEDRYKTLLQDDLCLTREPDDTATVRSCSHAVNQKWEWEGNWLTSQQGGYLTAGTDGSIRITPNASEALEWRSYFRKADSTDTLSIQTIPGE
ncbi:RICIN domain-containing protein [Kistimonas asteriae]|uniref:RICIN domain-containing protein n=1 Tax=Kistimonas asteriae TaxID=517724 RepID=UPI001BA80011|nr:RICIN domain-containing protein [Kistimonas asteriae]